MTDDGNYHAKVTGIVHAIYVSKRGIELIIHVPETASGDGTTQLTCRLDRSVSYSYSMLQLAQTALLNNLTISLLGYGDDTLEYDEIRISTDADLV